MENETLIVAVTIAVTGIITWLMAYSWYEDKYRTYKAAADAIIDQQEKELEYYDQHYIPKPDSIELKYKEKSVNEIYEEKVEAAKMDRIFGKVNTPSPEYDPTWKRPAEVEDYRMNPEYRRINDPNYNEDSPSDIH